jgi:hypothetical protein
MRELVVDGESQRPRMPMDASYPGERRAASGERRAASDKRQRMARDGGNVARIV